MDFKFESNIYRELCKIAQSGLLIERSKPVYWSWAAQTALAEAEVEYADKVSPSIFVAFDLGDEALSAIGENSAKLIIWTTTPWTLPANSGISLNPTEEYILTTDKFIVAKKLYQSLEESEVISGDIEKTVNQNSLENLFAVNPLNGRESKIVLGEHVLMDSGSGAVHTAPGHGEDDYRVGLKYNLDVIMPVDENGRYDDTITKMSLLPEEFVGVNVFDANDKILEMLGDNLLKRVDITHSYPHCWRTHKPIIFRATRQWFIAMDEKYNSDKTLRDVATEEIAKTSFYPEAGRNRLNSMISDRPDWCISRQRDWGVPIAFFREKSTGKVIFDEKVLNYIAMIFDIKGADAWYDLTIEELLYPGSGYSADELEKVNDILDVWFDSGSTQYAVLQSRNYDAGEFQADLYLEGSDQHRGWFQSSLLVSSVTNKKAPYKSILTHGFTVDSKGEKMSKSKGNVVAPKDVLKKYGSEILRLWVAMSDYQNDLKISDNILSQNAEQYRKLMLQKIAFLYFEVIQLSLI
jgi:isoleucyl-tRNA synthetase